METTELIRTASKYFRCNKVNVSNGANFKFTYDIGYFCIQISQEEDIYLGLVFNGSNIVCEVESKDFDSVCRGVFKYLKDVKAAISEALDTNKILEQEGKHGNNRID